MPLDNNEDGDDVFEEIQAATPPAAPAPTGIAIPGNLITHNQNGVIQFMATPPVTFNWGTIAEAPQETTPVPPLRYEDLIPSRDREEQARDELLKLRKLLSVERNLGGIRKILTQDEMKKKTKKVEASAKTECKKMDTYMDGVAPSDCSTIITLYNNSYPGASIDEFQFFKGLGWVHYKELYMFQESYKLCSIDNIFVKSELLARITTIENDGSSRDALASIKALEREGWFLCEIAGRFYHPKHKREVYSRPNITALVNEFCLESNTAVCTYTNKRFLSSRLKRIKGSDKYGLVNLTSLEDSEVFGRCPVCKNFFERHHLTSHANLYDGTPICNDCYEKVKYQGAIGPWNFKQYPPPMYSASFRMGHYMDRDGMICASMEKELVKNPRLLGVEAEVELWKDGCVKIGVNRFEMALRVKKVLGEDFVSCKEDGTLTLNGKYNGDVAFDKEGTKDGKRYAGFEIVTCPSDIAVQRERWSRIEGNSLLHNSKGTLLLRAWDTDTCGFHVHVSRDSLTTLQIGRMLRFINSTNNAKFIHKIAGRGSDVFCRYQDKELPDVLHPERVISAQEQNDYNRSRRVALNLANEKTVEFRIFRGTIHPNHILRNLCFVMAVCDYCYPASRSLRDMDDYGKFIHFVSKNIKNNQYKELAAWLVQQGEISKRKIMDGVDVRKLTINPDFVAEVPPDMKPSKTKATKRGDAPVMAFNGDIFENNQF